jgi:tRNA dimethylallyltransferase
MVAKQTSLITIVGPTASGKTDLAIRLAEELNGEILCADSRTIYMSADIGTAKPTKEQRQKVPHWGLDLIPLGERFTVHQFQAFAKTKITDIAGRGKLPIMVGGTGLYIDAVLYDFSFRSSPDPLARTELEALGVKELQDRLTLKGLEIPSNSNNKRHLIRTLETDGQQPIRQHLRQNTILCGIWPNDIELKQSINERIEQMYRHGFIEEIKNLLTNYPVTVVAGAGIGYASSLEYLDGRLKLEEAKALFAKGDWQYAKRQRTWFKRNPDIVWFKNGQAAYEHINKEFSKYR